MDSFALGERPGRLLPLEHYQRDRIGGEVVLGDLAGRVFGRIGAEAARLRRFGSYAAPLSRRHAQIRGGTGVLRRRRSVTREVRASKPT